jgi:spermidine synthase
MSITSAGYRYKIEKQKPLNRTMATTIEFDSHSDSSALHAGPYPFVHRNQRVTSLHFNILEVQSEMYNDAPDALALGYTRTMMGFLVFNSVPRHIGMIGLGGGSLQKYCYRNLPETRITVAEIDPEVIALRDDFHIPKDGPRFQILCDDGAHLVAANRQAFDILLVDGFDSTGQPPQLCSDEFYDACYASLTAGGILVSNICDDVQSILVQRIRRAFHDRVVAVGGDESQNTIVFADKGQFLTDSPTAIDGYKRTIRQLASSLKHSVPQTVKRINNCPTVNTGRGVIPFRPRPGAENFQD